MLDDWILQWAYRIFLIRVLVLAQGTHNQMDAIFNPTIVLSTGIIFGCSFLMYVMTEKQLPFPEWVTGWRVATFGIMSVFGIIWSFSLYFNGWTHSTPTVLIPIIYAIPFLFALVMTSRTFDLIEQRKFDEGFGQAKSEGESRTIYSGEELLEAASKDNKNVNGFWTNGLALNEMFELMAQTDKKKGSK